MTKGKQMIPALNKIGVHAAVYGNHDFGKTVFVFGCFNTYDTFFWK